MIEKRRLWAISKGELNPQNTVFLDETAFKTNLTRLYGWGPRNARLIDYVPYGHWKTTTFICGLRLDKIVAPYAVDGAMNRVKFLIYLNDVLGPTLQPGDVVICDNLNVHHGVEVASVIESFGARILFIPPYSPDENPIEMAYSKVKSLFRKGVIRTLDGLLAFLQTIPPLFSCTECWNYFKHANYVFT